MSRIVRNLNEDFAHVLNVVSSQRFLNKQGLGNEVPFFICPYPAQQAIDAEKHIRLLGKKLQAKGVQALEVILYDLSIELLKRREIFATIMEQEQDYSKAELKELLQGVLDPEQHLTTTLEGDAVPGASDPPVVDPPELGSGRSGQAGCGDGAALHHAGRGRARPTCRAARRRSRSDR